ncbi:MAG: hypothetical protein OEW98_07605, partial [Betaproteobacteria bacterium]|nr:hypothetical protein [Betaproteobacteria bacterium]
ATMESLMDTKSKCAITLIAAALAATALAQQPGATGGAVLASEPGKAVVARAAEMSAQVVGLDKVTRTLTLKGPKGNVVDIVAGDDVKNFDQIKLGDLVVARYVEALTLELKKAKVAGGDVVVREDAAKAKPGERPAVAGGRQITAIAAVTAVDPAKKTITLKGPRGNEVTLNVQNPDHFKVVKKGDQVEVTYTEALALAVEPAAKGK